MSSENFKQLIGYTESDPTKFIVGDHIRYTKIEYGNGQRKCVYAIITDINDSCYTVKCGLYTWKIDYNDEYRDFRFYSKNINKRIDSPPEGVGGLYIENPKREELKLGIKWIDMDVDDVELTADEMFSCRCCSDIVDCRCINIRQKVLKNRRVFKEFKKYGDNHPAYNKSKIISFILASKLPKVIVDMIMIMTDGDTGDNKNILNSDKGRERLADLHSQKRVSDMTNGWSREMILYKNTYPLLFEKKEKIDTLFKQSTELRQIYQYFNYDSIFNSNEEGRRGCIRVFNNFHNSIRRYINSKFENLVRLSSLLYTPSEMKSTHEKLIGYVRINPLLLFEGDHFRYTRSDMPRKCVYAIVDGFNSKNMKLKGYKSDFTWEIDYNNTKFNFYIKPSL